jgi:3',5'-cyclic AMP phosphodiesterase CpdA
MFLAGLRLPFPAIVRELLQYLHVSPSQIRPNGWRYFFATYIQWPTILDGHLMSIREFFHIYRVQAYTDGTIAFKSRGNSLFIFLHPTLLSNKVWRNEYFFVSGAWECSPTETLTEEQRILRRWSAPSAEGCSFFTSISTLSVFKLLNS